MILIYSAFPFNHAKIQKAVDIIKDRFSIFFIDDNDIFLSTQTSQKHLRDLIKNNPLFLFNTKSVKDMNMSPTQTAEIILFIIKNANGGKGCDFQSELDNIYFTKNDIDIVYPTIFVIFKKN